MATDKARADKIAADKRIEKIRAENDAFRKAVVLKTVQGYITYLKHWPESTDYHRQWAEYHIGQFYHHGLRDVSRNKKEAIKWYKKAEIGNSKNLAAGARRERKDVEDDWF